jgi:deoxycytidylate deaminase
MPIDSSMHAQGPDDHAYFMRQAIALSAKAGLVDKCGACFGAVVVKDGVIVGEGCNQVRTCFTQQYEMRNIVIDSQHTMHEW